MNLVLKRDAVQSGHATFGELYADGVLECETMEQPVREIEDALVSNWKIKGDSAIPRGRYRIVINRSQRLKYELPLLLNVPWFEDVRISPNCLEAGTDGWIVVGTERLEMGLVNSRIAFSELFQDIRDALNAGEQVWVTVG